MCKIHYNSSSIEYKWPFGAVKTNCEVLFRIAAEGIAMPCEVRLLYHKDADSAASEAPMAYVCSSEGLHYYECKLSFDKPNLYFYHFEIKTPDGILYCGADKGNAAIGYGLPEWQLTVYDEEFKTPDWAKGGIMYQLFPDRFNRSTSFTPLPSKNERKIHDNWYDAPEFIYDTEDFKANDFFCGNIDGIIEKLEYLKKLGVGIVYLNPIFESPENHRYSTADYLNIDPYFGTNEDFERLTNECKKAGISIILDGVFSHTGADSIYFNKFGNYPSDGAYNSPESPYFHWYSFSEYPEKYECWWGFENLPNVNECAPDYLDFITNEKNGVLSYWQEKGAMGWRIDVADELPDLFIDRMRSTIKKCTPDALLIGEVWEDASNKVSYGSRRRYLLGQQFDSVMNYPWRSAIIDYVLSGDADSFSRCITGIAENYPQPALDCLMNSLSTHDTARIINVFGVMNKEIQPQDKKSYVLSDEEYQLGKSRLKLAAFLQFTLPGIPCIYYGDEVGLTGFEDPYCRMCYPFGREDTDLLGFFRALASVRTENREDFCGGLEFISVRNSSIAFRRNKLVCIINTGSRPEPLDPACEGELLFGTEPNGGSIAPYSYCIIKTGHTIKKKD